MPSDERRAFHNKVFFCDIVGYSRRSAIQQLRCQQYLTEVLRIVVGGLGLALEHDTVALPTGDGLVLNFLAQQPDIHLRVASEVLRHMHKTQVAGDVIGLRVGLNSDIDTLVTDINDKKNIVGNGINLAQRVMDLGRHGQILMHDRVRVDLGNYPEYEGKIVYRGDYTVKHGTRLPVSQFIDPASVHINNELLPPPAAPPPTVDLDTILNSIVHGNLLRVTLDLRAQHHLQDVRDYMLEFLDRLGEFQRLKVAVTWIASEMLDNAFRHGQHGPKDTVILALDRSTDGILIATEQPDVAAFEAESVLRTPAGDEVSFMRLVAQRGLRWRQRRHDGRLTLSVEVPADFEIRPLTIQPATRSTADLPANVAAFVNGLVDFCAHEKVTLIRPLGRIDHASADQFQALLAPHLSRGSARIVLDLSRVEYIASAGWRVLMLAARQSRATSGVFVLAAPTPLVQEQLEISRFSMILDVYATSEAAFEALTRP